ncbi:hypothetical protein GQ607_004140 [Colletotrichum asianum]|uniref:F-box domain-containing protein n=1 Tax=Colletotrichum asianum TaxID=702518 RepID=A0A8H3WQJ8_9PEZI|nr:hypothetical protein GQ607_004140 [Colletotrichum asianum]
MPYLLKAKRNKGRKKMISFQQFLDDEHRTDAVPALEQASDDALPGWLIRRQQNQTSRLHSLPDELILEIIDCMDVFDFWVIRQVSHRLANVCAGFHIYNVPRHEAQRRQLRSERESENWIRRCYQRYVLLYPAFVDRSCSHRFCDGTMVSKQTRKRLEAITRKFFETDVISLQRAELNISLETVRYPGETFMAQYLFRKKARNRRIANLLCSGCRSTNNQTYRYDSPVDGLLNQECKGCADGYDPWCFHYGNAETTILSYPCPWGESSYSCHSGLLQLCAHRTFTWPDMHHKLVNVGTVSSSKGYRQNKFPFVECTDCFSEILGHDKGIKQPAVLMMKDRAHCYLLLEWCLPMFKLRTGVPVTHSFLRKTFDRVGEKYEALLCPHVTFFDGVLRRSLLENFWDTDELDPGVRFCKRKCKFCGFKYLLKRFGNRVYLEGNYTMWYQQDGMDKINPEIGGRLAELLEDPTPHARLCRSQGISWCQTKGCFNAKR